MILHTEHFQEIQGQSCSFQPCNFGPTLSTPVFSALAFLMVPHFPLPYFQSTRSQVWSPHFRCDIEKIENVQRRFTKAILPHFTYSARLSKLKLQTLKMRRITTDLTMCYILLNGLTETDYKFALSRSSISQTRGNSLKLNKRHLASTRDAALFHNRIIKLWNALPDYIVTARSVSCFNRYLLNYANNVGNDFFTSRYY